MEKKKKSQSFWSWKISDDDLKNQIKNYDSLKITESYRGISVIVYSAMLMLGLLLSFFGAYSDPNTIILGIIFYIPILFFVYKGHRWAIILLMIMWTIEKGYQLYGIGQSGSGNGIVPILWWLAFMPCFWKALKIENERRIETEEKTIDTQEYQQVEADNNSRIFCSNCGKEMPQLSNFCKNCGNKITQ